MYTNIANSGVAKQLSLYAQTGDAIIYEYVSAKNAGLTPASIIAAMTSKIIEVGPWSIADASAFLAEIKSAKGTGEISRFFSPEQHDPAFHIEVPQP